ncbi:MAG: hypothetical protein Q8L55_05655 [Phycisphaerales bacterium]|nr:hypothetical protein [Phycisphaerales bacterium]
MSTGTRTRLAASLLILLGGASGCTSDAVRPTAAPPAAAAHADDHHGPHNLHWVKARAGDGKGAGAGLLSGGTPESDDDFAFLARLGIKTLISVDGAAPDVDRAGRHGMAYIHMPTTYAQVSPQQQLEVARAVKSSMTAGSIYIHCHHGKHRGPAQAAGAAIALGWFTPAEGVAFMKLAGTAPTYAGLYACIAEAVPADAAALNAPIEPGEFTSIRRPLGITAAMVEIDLAFEHLGQIRAAGWQVPKDQPDLVPAAEAGRMADHLRISGEDPASRSRGDAYMQRLAQAAASAAALEGALVRGLDVHHIEARWAPVAASCSDCHKPYRDRR